MKIITRDIVTSKPIDWAHFSDAHYGGKACDKDLLQESIDFVEENDYYWSTGGDMCDCIVPDDPRFDRQAYDWELFESDEDEDSGYGSDVFVYIDKQIELFKKIRERCIGWAAGNHELGAAKKKFRGMTKRIVKGLNEIPETVNKIRYLGWTWHLRLRFRHPYLNLAPRLLLVMGEHGYTSARTPGGLRNALARRLAEWPMIQLLLWGHSHVTDIYPQDVIGASSDPGQEHDKDYLAYKRYGVVCPSMCDTYKLNAETWAETKCFRPASKGLMTIRIDPWHPDGLQIYPKLAIERIAQTEYPKEEEPEKKED